MEGEALFVSADSPADQNHGPAQQRLAELIPICSPLDS